ncbi:MAG TPA: L,D-transpeptidase [Planctomycetota bacterium]|nr:L,D-transpeptidase [Planctomycetota bacterium]
MWGFIKTRLVPLFLVVAALACVAGVGLLQEFEDDEIPALCTRVGVALPLTDPRLEVSTLRGVLELWDGDVRIKVYDCAFGEDGAFNRTAAGRPSTPLGEFRIVEKQVREDVLARGPRFLRLDYPDLDAADRGLSDGLLTAEHYDAIRTAAAAGLPTPVDTPLGGPLGIQGNWFFWRPRHFTDGSIALANADLNELFRHVPIGTPVIVRE